MIPQYLYLINSAALERFFSLLENSFYDRPFYSCLLSDLAFEWSEVRIDLVLIQISLLLLCKLSCSNANQGINMTKAKKSLLPFKGQQNAGHSAENYKTVKSR